MSFRKKTTPFHLLEQFQWITSLLLFYLTIQSGTCVAINKNGVSKEDEILKRTLLSTDETLFWLSPEDDVIIPPDDILLSRGRRDVSNSTNQDLTIWEKIEEFYSDKNNMAMYCVLPLLILIYGGCSSLYCIHKCRLYLRRRKHKRLKEEDCDSLTSDKNNSNENVKSLVDNDRPISQISQAWVDMNMDPKGKWSGQAPVEPNSGQSPLPWQNVETEASSDQFRKPMSTSGLLEDALKEEDKLIDNGRRSQNTFKPKTASEGTTAVTNVSSNETTVLQKHAEDHEMKQFGASKQQNYRPPVVKTTESKPFEETRAHVNLEDYASNKSSAVKATDYSRFSDARPIEIVPLTADPHLRGWDPLHNRPFGDPGFKFTQLGAEGGTNEDVNRMSSKNIKEEMLARYDALSAFQMAKKAAEILKVNAVEKSPFERKPTKKKQIFIAE